jgi:hypothetical protein
MKITVIPGILRDSIPSSVSGLGLDSIPGNLQQEESNTAAESGS